mmetsp:Transcript_17695/g.39227  ORF Transcript_17695/g.39227 Transcript_17695/m.39227 type:complete len:100 (-) Transcript_17695:1149-1448(-)
MLLSLTTTGTLQNKHRTALGQRPRPTKYRLARSQSMQERLPQQTEIEDVPAVNGPAGRVLEHTAHASGSTLEDVMPLSEAGGRVEDDEVAIVAYSRIPS